MSRYRSKDDFKVTVTELCNKCQTFQPEVKNRCEYVCTHGWVEQVPCQACFDKAREAAKNDQSEYKGWDYV